MNLNRRHVASPTAERSGLPYFNQGVMREESSVLNDKLFFRNLFQVYRGRG